MSFRNTIGATALMHVQNFLGAKFGDVGPEQKADLISKHVRVSMLYHGEIPFLYRVFDPTNVTAKKERGGYKVVRIPSVF